MKAALKKGMTAKERDIIQALEAILRMEKGEKVKGFTTFIHRGPVGRKKAKVVRKTPRVEPAVR